MEKRILAVLIAALAGGAYAQSNVTSGERMQVAQADRSARSTEAPARAGDKSTSTQSAGATTSAANPPPTRGYVGSGAGVVATNPFGLCWRMGSDWTPDKAAAPCDAVPRAAVAPVPVAAAPAAAPAPTPIVAAAPPPQPVVIEKITLSTDVLFGFNKAELTPAGQQKLDELAKNAQGAESNKNHKLIACLQPDRRVDAELLGSREQTAGSTPATGAAGTTGTTGSSSGSASGTVSAPGSSGASGYSGASGRSPGSSGSSSSSESGSTNK